jgi:hypothetical protein
MSNIPPDAEPLPLLEYMSIEQAPSKWVPGKLQTPHHILTCPSCTAKRPLPEDRAAPHVCGCGLHTCRHDSTLWVWRSGPFVSEGAAVLDVWKAIHS